MKKEALTDINLNAGTPSPYPLMKEGKVRQCIGKELFVNKVIIFRRIFVEVPGMK